MIYNKIKKIEVIANEDNSGYHLVFDGKVLEVQRKEVRNFSGLNHVANFFQDLHEKSYIEKSMQERDLKSHLEQGGINKILITKNDDGFIVSFEVNDVIVELITQKSKRRVFKSIHALLSFIKNFFGNKVYELKNIELNVNDENKLFITKGDQSAYELFVLELANPLYEI